jgi:hypothetical protein
MLRYLLLVVSHRRLCHGAHVALLRLGGVGVVGGQDGGRGAHDGADGVVHGLALGLLYGRLQRGALGREGRPGLGHGDGGMLVEVVVVVGGGADDGARLGEGVSIPREEAGDVSYLAILGEVDLGVVGRQHVVGRADDWAEVSNGRGAGGSLAAWTCLGK